MRYEFDGWGWFTSTSEDDEASAQSTDLKCPKKAAVVGQPHPNWTGKEWAMMPYVEPPAPEPAPEPEKAARRITKLAFRSRFTSAEKVGLELASIDNPSGPAQQRQLAAALRVHQTDLQAAQFVDLDFADTRNGVQQLEAVGLLAQGRALKILDAPILAHETFGG
jgi:hypothetical protein